MTFSPFQESQKTDFMKIDFNIFFKNSIDEFGLNPTLGLKPNKVLYDVSLVTGS